MKTQKAAIIKAFENLDADALQNLLDENRTYQDVPKSIFVAKFRDIFEDLKKDEFEICDFKAYPGTCKNCTKGAKGFSFVNSQNTCYANIIFEGNDDVLTDIYSCSNFCSSHSDIKEGFYGINFDDDQKVGFMLSFDELVEKEFCLRATDEIKRELNEKKVLSVEFMLNWRDKYGRNYDNIDIFNDIRFTFTTEIRGYLGSIRNALSFIDLSRKAKFYLDLFQDKVFEDSEAKMMWLIACLEDIPDITFLLHAKIHQNENYITFSKINVDLALMKDYLVLQKLFNELHDLLPYTILNHLPWDWKDPSQPDKNEDPVFGDNDEDLPF